MKYLILVLITIAVLLFSGTVSEQFRPHLTDYYVRENPKKYPWLEHPYPWYSRRWVIE